MKSKYEEPATPDPDSMPFENLFVDLGNGGEFGRSVRNAGNLGV